MTPESGPATTAGVIALGNLEARIDGQAWQATRGRLTVGERAELVERMCAHSHVCCQRDLNLIACSLGSFRLWVISSAERSSIRMQYGSILGMI